MEKKFHEFTRQSVIIQKKLQMFNTKGGLILKTKM